MVSRHGPIVLQRVHGFYNSFRYELDNHEYSYTMDLSDTLDALDYTPADINADKRLRHGLEKACAAILASA